VVKARTRRRGSRGRAREGNKKKKRESARRTPAYIRGRKKHVYSIRPGSLVEKKGSWRKGGKRATRERAYGKKGETTFGTYKERRLGEGRRFLWACRGFGRLGGGKGHLVGESDGRRESQKKKKKKTAITRCRGGESIETSAMREGLNDDRHQGGGEK